MVPDIHAKFHNQQCIMRRTIKPFLAISTCFSDPSTTELCLWCDCATKKLTFYTTPAVLLLLRVSSITVCVHRNSLQRCKMTQRRGKRENQSYTMKPQAMQPRSSTRCLVNKAPLAGCFVCSMAARALRAVNESVLIRPL